MEVPPVRNGNTRGGASRKGREKSVRHFDTIISLSPSLPVSLFLFLFLSISFSLSLIIYLSFILPLSLILSRYLSLLLSLFSTFRVQLFGLQPRSRSRTDDKCTLRLFRLFCLLRQGIHREDIDDTTTRSSVRLFARSLPFFSLLIKIQCRSAWRGSGKRRKGGRSARG